MSDECSVFTKNVGGMLKYIPRLLIFLLN